MKLQLVAAVTEIDDGVICHSVRKVGDVDHRELREGRRGDAEDSSPEGFRPSRDGVTIALDFSRSLSRIPRRATGIVTLLHLYTFALCTFIFTFLHFALPL